MSIIQWLGLFHLGSVATVLLTLVFASRILRSPRMPAITIGWLSVIVFLPVLGIPLYLTFGERKLDIQLGRKEKLALHGKCAATHAVRHPIHSLLVSLGVPASTSRNTCRFHDDGVMAWEALQQLLENADVSIDIAIFILGNDAVGRRVIRLLEEKAAAGVRVRLLLDGVGSLPLSRKRLRELGRAGGEIAWFIPVIHRPFRGRTNLRNHRKIVIVDRKMVWAGGRNISGEYLGPHCPAQCWIDLSYTQTGDVVATYLEIFEADWRFAKGGRVAAALPIVPMESEAPAACELQVIPSGPDIDGDPIYSTILTACYVASSRIYVATPYFIPDDNVQTALKLAALRGVAVEMILPERSNHRLADIARNRFLRELLEAGVTLRFLPEMIHAKAIVIDDSFAMCGSANLDIRSLFLNCELMSAFYGKAEVAWLARWFDALRAGSIRHRPEKAGAVTELIEGIVMLTAYQL